MLMLSIEGWLNGLTAVGIFIFGGCLGVFFIYQSKKTNAKLLMYLSLFLVISILAYWGVLFDFLTLLITDTVWFPPNSINEDIRNMFVWMWGGLIPLPAIYIGAKLLIPNKKWYLISIMLILMILLEIFLFVDVRGSIDMIYDNEIPLGRFSPESPPFFILLILTFSVVIFNVGGFFLKSTQSNGVIRKKNILLAIGFLCFSIFLSTEGLIMEIKILIFTRIGLIISYWIVYLGLREEPEKPQEPKKKEIKVEGDLFRVIKNRPEDITEEEVTISKEKKICIVCKGKVGGFNFICTECGTFYCKNCINSLINLENACWVCNTPFDKTKPSKPYEKEEDIKLKISEDIEKKIKE